MRNLGPCRNAEYNFKPTVDESHNGTFYNTGMSRASHQTPQQARQQFIKARGNKNTQDVIDYKNRDVYSFGGKTKIKKKYHHINADEGLHEYNPIFSKTGSKWTQSVDRSQKVIYREYNQQVNDYSKNVSDNIFSPGYIMPTNVIRRTQTGGRNKRRIGNQRRSVTIPQKMQKFIPGRPNAIQLNKTQHQVRKTTRPTSNRPTSNKSHRSAHSLTRKLHAETR
jgi:hypothetical protein